MPQISLIKIEDIDFEGQEATTTFSMREMTESMMIWMRQNVTKNMFRLQEARGVNHMYMRIIPANERPYVTRETATRPGHLSMEEIASIHFHDDGATS